MVPDPIEEFGVVGVEDVGDGGFSSEPNRGSVLVVSEGMEIGDIEAEEGTVRVLDGEDVRGSATTVVTLHDSINLSRAMLSMWMDL